MNLTVVAPVRLVPVKVTVVPVFPLVGAKPEIVGVAPNMYPTRDKQRVNFNHRKARRMNYLKVASIIEA